MKNEVCEKESWFSIVRINFILFLVFLGLNDMDYFSTYLSLVDGGFEINPVVIFLLEIPLVFFIWKILILPCVVWYFAYESESRRVMWSLVGIDLVYFVVVLGNLRVVL